MFGPARHADSSPPPQESLIGKVTNALSLLFSFSVLNFSGPRRLKSPVRPTICSPSLYVGISGQASGLPSFNLAGSSLEEVVRNANALVRRQGRDHDLAALAPWVVRREDFHVGVDAFAPHHSRLHCQSPFGASHNREGDAELIEVELVGLADQRQRL